MSLVAYEELAADDEEQDYDSCEDIGKRVVEVRGSSISELAPFSRKSDAAVLARIMISGVELREPRYHDRRETAAAGQCLSTMRVVGAADEQEVRLTPQSAPERSIVRMITFFDLDADVARRALALADDGKLIAVLCSN